MTGRTTEILDDHIIALAAHALDLAERDLDVPAHTEELRAALLGMLRRLNERAQSARPATTALPSKYPGRVALSPP